MNTPATLPGFEKKPPLWLICGRSVCAGGAVGVIVKVLTWPVTVITETTGVGVHDGVAESGAEVDAEADAEVESEDDADEVAVSDAFAAGAGTSSTAEVVEVAMVVGDDVEVEVGWV